MTHTNHQQKPDLKNPSSLQQPKIQTLLFQSNRVTPAPSNGDLYAGSLVNNVPHGYGKYLWLDGCMYEGEWKKGKANGKGKFSWPSGATYEGEFKGGKMEGYGVFVGVDGDTYRGNLVNDRKHGYGEKWYGNGGCYEGDWVNDRKHGYGEMRYGNGDCYRGNWVNDRRHGYGEMRYGNGGYYEGNWRKDVEDGWGRYVWKNGNEYCGDWRNGVVCGNGVLSWGNGKRFEGVWDNGVLRKGKKGGENGGENRICVWESDGDGITCDIVDGVEVEEGKNVDKFVGMGKNGGFERCSNGESDCCVVDECKKQGQTISKGHKNYDLMLNLQLGIRYSVGKHASILRELTQTDFDPKEKFWTRFPPEGSKTTPPHHSTDFKWKDYCPIVFRHLRELFEVDPADYMLAICGNDALRELSSPGKSGSFFYLTQDDRFMIKTVKKSEVKVLLRMLPSYYKHVSQYENSLVTRFYGVHCVKPANGPKTRFVVMGNLFCSEYRIHRRFDLKGSRYGRTIEKTEDEIDETTTLKDLDLNFAFRLQKDWYHELIKQIERDCEFLEAERIMDYSLLVGVHFRGDNTEDKMGLSPFLLRGEMDSYQNEKYLRGCRMLEAELHDMDRVLAGRKPLIRLGANMPARAEKLTRRSDFDQYIPGSCGNLTSTRSGDDYEVVLYFGIIDILQDYDITKRIEHAYKSLQIDPTTISAVDPKHYSKRFRDFIGRIFIEDR